MNCGQNGQTITLNYWLNDSYSRQEQIWSGNIVSRCLCAKNSEKILKTDNICVSVVAKRYPYSLSDVGVESVKKKQKHGNRQFKYADFNLNKKPCVYGKLAGDSIHQLILLCET